MDDTVSRWNVLNQFRKTAHSRIISILVSFVFFTSMIAANEAQAESRKNLAVHYLDVGQADSILIELPNSQIMLIDGGNKEDGAAVMDYLRDREISTIHYLVATHPHEDHIGGLPYIIDSSLEIESIYMPRVSSLVAPQTQIFEKLLMSIGCKGLSIKTAFSGVCILSIPNLQIDIISPVSNGYAELNDWSAVIRLKYGDTVFLFMGDAETASINQITADIDADVIKIGHHGGKSSTTDSFLKKVTPDYAVICVGKGNGYGHPDEATLAALNENGVEVFRTDTHGTIVITSDGNTISVGKQPIPYSSHASIHSADCRHLQKE